MNLPEATQLLRAVKAFCPSQQIDTYTFEAWAAVLGDIRYADASEAVMRIASRDMEPGESRYIEPGHIRREVRRIRQERIDRHPQVEPPVELESAAFLEWYRKTLERIADGEIIEQKALPVRKVDYSGIVKGVEDARVQLRAVQESARVPGPSDDDEPADQGGEVRGAEAYRRAESSPARAGHRVDI